MHDLRNISHLLSGKVKKERGSSGNRARIIDGASDYA
jgi:hypothetical protein